MQYRLVRVGLSDSQILQPDAGMAFNGIFFGILGLLWWFGLHCRTKMKKFDKYDSEFEGKVE